MDLKKFDMSTIVLTGGSGAMIGSMVGAKKASNILSQIPSANDYLSKAVEKNAENILKTSGNSYKKLDKIFARVMEKANFDYKNIAKRAQDLAANTKNKYMVMFLGIGSAIGAVLALGECFKKPAVDVTPQEPPKTT